MRLPIPYSVYYGPHPYTYPWHKPSLKWSTIPSMYPCYFSDQKGKLHARDRRLMACGIHYCQLQNNQWPQKSEVEKLLLNESMWTHVKEKDTHKRGKI